MKLKVNFSGLLWYIHSSRDNCHMAAGSFRRAAEEECFDWPRYCFLGLTFILYMFSHVWGWGWAGFLSRGGVGWRFVEWTMSHCHLYETMR